MDNDKKEEACILSNNNKINEFWNEQMFYLKFIQKSNQGNSNLKCKTCSGDTNKKDER